MRNYLLGSAALAALLTLAPATKAEELKLGHIRPQASNVHQELTEFAEAVAQTTGGETTIQLYPASALGDYTVVQERVSIGAIEMALQPPATGLDRRMQLSVMPYLVEDWEAAKKAFGPGGPISTEMTKLYAEQDITVLGAYPVYFGGIALNRDAIEPGNPDAKKGIKLRVPPIRSYQLLGEAIGYISTPIPFSEAFTAIQTGVVDGVLGAGAEGYYASFRDVTQSYIPANTHFEVWYLLINTGVLEGLEDTARANLETAAAEFVAKRWEVAPTEQKTFEQRLAQAGATINELTSEELSALATSVREKVWPEVVNDIGADFAQPILDQLAK